eukprot:Selendium_serpulae@DN4883_c0_g1_i2.p1
MSPHQPVQMSTAEADPSTTTKETCLSLRDRLSEVRQELSEWLKQPDSDTKSVNIVVGNVSADLDSVCSALCGAALFEALSNQKKEKSNPSSSQLHQTLDVPVINVPAEDFSARLKVAHWVKKHSGLGLRGDEGSGKGKLIFNDDALVRGLLQDTLQKKSWGISLVDHNELDHAQQHWAPRVRAVVDHHVDAGGHAAAAPRLIVAPPGVGSNATLIAELWRSNGLRPPSQVCHLLLGPIAFDSGNFNEALKGRWGERDVEAFKWLAALTGRNDPTALSSEIFAELTALKMNEKKCLEIGLKAALNSDRKTFNYSGHHVGYGVLECAFDAWTTSRDAKQILEDLRQYKSTNKFDLLIVTFVYHDTAPSVTTTATAKRELLIFTSNQKLFDHVSKGLRSSELLLLRDHDNGSRLKAHLDSQAAELLEVFIQGNVAASRKQVEPLVRSLCNQLAQDGTKS